MIEFTEPLDAQIARQCGHQANKIETLHASMEMLMRQGDNEAVCAYATSIAKSAKRIADDAAFLATR